MKLTAYAMINHTGGMGAPPNTDPQHPEVLVVAVVGSAASVVGSAASATGDPQVAGAQGHASAPCSPAGPGSESGRE